MKNKGFTLIELLAVILILGIIALIAIPTVTSVVEQSRRGAADNSATSFVKAVEELTITKDLSGNKLANGDYTVAELLELGIDLKGTMPDSGFVVIEANDVTNCQLIFGDYVINCGENENEVIKYDLASFTPAENSSYLGMVYYNPTEGKKCTKADFESNLASYNTDKLDSNGNKYQSGMKSGCMIWYIYKDNGNGTINMILNHNIINAEVYSKEKLKNETIDWKNEAGFMSIVDFAKIIKADKFLGFDVNKKFVAEEINIKKYQDGKISNIYLNTLYELSNENDKYRFFWFLENLITDDVTTQKYLAKISSNDKIGVGNLAGMDVGYYFDEKVDVSLSLPDDNGEYYWAFSDGLTYYQGNVRSTFSKMLIGPSRSSWKSGFRPVISIEKDVLK